MVPLKFGTVLGLLFAIPLLSGCETTPSPPSAVVEKVSRLAPGMKILEFEQETEGSTVSWEVEVESDAEITLSPDGTLVEFETEIPVGLVPAVIREATALRGAELSEAEIILSSGAATIEVEVRSGGKSIDYVFDLQGTLLSTEEEEEEEEEEEDDGDDGDDGD